MHDASKSKPIKRTQLDCQDTISVSATGNNHQGKNNLFREVFSSNARVADVVRALDGVNGQDIDIKTLRPVIFGKKENDLSFLCNNTYYYFIEQQSTYNPNMPLRLLQYVASGLANFFEAHTIYGSLKVSLSIPRLYTIFVGCTEKEDKIVGNIKGIQLLSDLFIDPKVPSDLEVTVHTSDFNMTYWEVERYLLDENAIPARFSEVAGSAILHYALFASCYAGILKYAIPIAKNGKADDNWGVYELCKLFEARNILRDVFQKEEVCNMLLQEFSRDNQLRYEGREEGI